jgi:DNA-directed RNA polymerase subunit omega
MNDKYLQRALEKIPDKRSLILLAAKRAKQLAKGERPLVKHKELDHVDVALLEIAEGLITFDMPNKEEETDFLN